MKLNDSGIRRVWPCSLHNRQQTHQPEQKSRLPAGSASATAGRLTGRLEGGAVYAGHCPYCHQFDPVLKQLAQQYGFSVFPTPGWSGDTAFPEALPVPPDVMQTFFPNIPVATPTTFRSTSTHLRHYRFCRGNGCRQFYGADGYRSADVRRGKRCEISRWCYSLPEYPASRRE